jgi:hypothetical protein
MTAVARAVMVAACAALAILAGCAGGGRPVRAQVESIVVRGHMEGDAAREMAVAGAETVRDLCAALELPRPTEPVSIHAFNWWWQRTAFLIATCPAQWSARAACFTSAGGGTVIAMTQEWAREERLRLVRHEAAHYVLHAHFTAVPPWAHEGLAQYFEMGPPYGGAHPTDLDRVLGEARGGKAGKLDALVRVPCGTGLGRKDYARAWALVGCILKTLPDGGPRLRRYLAQVTPMRDAAAQFEEVFGATPEGMGPAWRAFVLGLEAGREMP